MPLTQPATRAAPSSAQDRIDIMETRCDKVLFPRSPRRRGNKICMRCVAFGATQRGTAQTMKTLLALAAALPLAISTNAALGNTAFSYSGNWKISLTHDVFPNTTGYHGHGPDTTHCVELAD